MQSSGKQQKTKLREEAILEKAREVIIAEGTGALKMPELAKLSQVSVGTLYRHFESKQDIIAALASRALDARHQKLKLVKEQFQEPDERYLGVIMLDFLFNIAHPDVFQIEMACASPAFWEETQSFRHQSHQAVAKDISSFLQSVCSEISGPEADLKHLATGIWAFVSGMSLVWYGMPSKQQDNLEEALCFLRMHLINFIKGYGLQLSDAGGTFSHLEKHFLATKSQWLWALKGKPANDSH
ncbi:TetR/AcrR family transcriptional regulator [Pseudovibrio sp. WM33]|uniref:TetR/AcrR family transcriptional regulator n=1 Tax=Pseudovibrio sp. WM33 TaxID=1735585 RepID=UPI0007AE68F3|nr:TetR/AcrR family transcriptional regulator [Pseudovibrio sp. WM33]KZL23236.1 Bacterial regulatory protein, tetR family [Pseudovibrio sp. WM33]